MSAETKKTGEDWGDIENVPQQKRGFPKWLLFCGGGCLVLVVLGVIGAYFGYEFFKKGQNPDVQYPALERSIALDHRLEDFDIFGWEIMGSEGYAFTARSGTPRMAMLFVADTPQEREEFGEMLDPEKLKEGGQFGEAQEIEQGTILVQGRELRIVRAAMKEMKLMPGQKSEDSGTAAFLDVSNEGSSDLIVMMYMRPESKERVTDEEIVEFLRPFHVGPQRETSVPTPPDGEAPGPSEDEPDDGG